jgi:protein O-GlcNAc transferase
LLDAASRAEVEGRISLAVDLLQRSVDDFRKKGETARPKVLAHLARLYCLNGPFTVVERRARSGLLEFQEDFNLNNMLAIALWNLGRAADALAIADRASSLNLRDAQPIATQAHIYSEKQDFERALALLEKARRIDSGSADYLRLAAMVNARLSRHWQAIDYLSQACDLRSDDVANWLTWAKIETEADCHAEALAVLERALQNLPGSDAILDAKTIVLRRAGRIQDTITFLRSHLEQFPHAAWAHYQLGHALARSDQNIANTHFRLAADLSPCNQMFLIDCADSLSRTRGSNEANNIEEAFNFAERVHLFGELQPRNSAIAAGIFRRVDRFYLEDELEEFRAIGSDWADDGYHFALHTSLAHVETLQGRDELLRLHQMWGEALVKKVNIRPLLRLSGLSDRHVTQVIADDNLDILFELGAGTDMNRVEVLAYKPAPIQVSCSDIRTPSGF